MPGTGREDNFADHAPATQHFPAFLRRPARRAALLSFTPEKGIQSGSPVFAAVPPDPSAASVDEDRQQGVADAKYDSSLLGVV